MIDVMTWMDDDLNDRRARGLYRGRRSLQSAQGTRVLLRGRELINFASNDYLDLAADPRLIRAATRAARRYGCGAGASPLVVGYLPPLRALERALAQWEGTEAALVFSSGFAANLAVVSTLAGAEDVIFSDALNHASLIDGCRLSRAAVHVYRHADINHLAELLHNHGYQGRRRLIVTDTVFSMDGDFAPLTDLLDLGQRFDCFLVLDEAHATGVLGEQGRGLTELLLPQTSNEQRTTDNDRIIKIGTLSKALGAQGGFVCGSHALIDWLVNTARPYIFSTALAPPAAAAARRAVALAQQEPERRRHLLGLADLLREQLCRVGFPDTGSRCQIVPVVVGKSRTALAFSASLEEQGLLVPAIRPPSVPEDTARLRISLSAGHSEQDVARLAEALKALPAQKHV
jgi:8-amino-7-oxononanoate synthase